MDYLVAIEGLSDLDVENAPARLKRIASQAINRTLRETRTLAAREMRSQINFGARYLTGSEDGRLKVAAFSQPGSLEGRIQGRDRPTSLARFIRGSRRPGRRGVTVEVGTGNRQRLDRAFVVKLSNENTFLALRLKQGERIENKKIMARSAYGSIAGRRKSDANLYLLYGPSVDQVFRTVAQDVSPEAARRLEAEFNRQVDTLL